MSTLATIHFKREPGWTEFFIQCPKIEAIIKELSKNKQITLEESGDYSPEDMSPFSSYRYYVIQGAPPPLPSGKKVWGSFANGILLNGNFNMRYLCFVGLTEGVKIKFTKPFPRQLMKELVLQGIGQMKEFLIEYGAVVQGTVTLIEKE